MAHQFVDRPGPGNAADWLPRGRETQAADHAVPLPPSPHRVFLVGPDLGGRGESVGGAGTADDVAEVKGNPADRRPIQAALASWSRA